MTPGRKSRLQKLGAFEGVALLLAGVFAGVAGLWLKRELKAFVGKELLAGPGRAAFAKKSASA